MRIKMEKKDHTPASFNPLQGEYLIHATDASAFYRVEASFNPLQGEYLIHANLSKKLFLVGLNVSIPFKGNI